MYLKNINQASPGAAPLPLPPCYNIGDTGPAGGIIVSVPGVGVNTSNFYYEVPPTISIYEATIQTGNPLTFNVDYSCNTAGCGGATDPDDGIGVELGCWNQIITSQFGTNTSHEFGTGLQNTMAVISNSNNTYQFFSNWDNAFNLADNYSLGGFDDWFLPSVGEIREASDNGFNVNPGGFLPATSSGYIPNAYSIPINDQYPGLPDSKVFLTYKPSMTVDYLREVRGQDLTVIPMRRFVCAGNPNTDNCDPCSIVYTDSSGSQSTQGWKIMSSLSATPVFLTYNGNPYIYTWNIPGYNIHPEVARSGDKLWTFGTTPQNDRAIIEFTINSDCVSVSLSKIMPFVSSFTGNFGIMAGACAKDSTTMLSNFSLSYQATYNFTVVEIDVSGANAIVTILYPAGTSVFWDLIYIPSSDSILGINSSGYAAWLDYSTGAILDEQTLPGILSFALFSHQGKIYTPAGGNSLYELDLSGGTISAINPIALNKTMGDAATSPDCCDDSVLPDEPPCFYNVGDVGPGGGIIFITPTSLPGQNFYYEIAMNDVITSNTTLAEFQEVPSYINPTYINTLASPAGAEWGAFKSSISLSATGTSAGIGLGPSNTSTIVNHPQCPGIPCHPLISNNYIAAALCTNYNGGGMSDWFLPSVFELQTLFINSGALNDLLYPGNGQYALSGMHWTSSAVHDPGNPQVDGLAWAFNTDGFPVAYQGYRDKKLSVRPVRRFECPAINFDGYNYRDGYGSNSNPWWQAPFTPGQAGSGPSVSGNLIQQDCIGFPIFTISLALEDVLGNVYGEDSFNTINNPNGYFISIWDNNKNFLGKWKYETCEKETVKDNWLNFANLTPNIPSGTAGVPRMVDLKLENPTHLEGQHPIVKYGGNNFNNTANVYAAGVDYINHYNLDYESGTYLQFTSSYCFIKFECDVTNANNYESIYTGPNTDPQLLNTICVGDRTYSGGNTNYRTSGRIGVGVGIHFPNPKNNTNFNSVYGVPLNLNLQYGSYPDLIAGDFPLHFIHPWFGSNPPDANLQSYGVQWFPDFLSAYNGGCISPENTGPLAPAIDASMNNKPYIKKQTKCCGEK